MSAHGKRRAQWPARAGEGARAGGRGGEGRGPGKGACVAADTRRREGEREERGGGRAAALSQVVRHTSPPLLVLSDQDEVEVVGRQLGERPPLELVRVAPVERRRVAREHARAQLLGLGLLAPLPVEGHHADHVEHVRHQRVLDALVERRPAARARGGGRGGGRRRRTSAGRGVRLGGVRLLRGGFCRGRGWEACRGVGRGQRAAWSGVRGGERAGDVDLDEPRLEVLVEEDVEAEDLEARRAVVAGLGDGERRAPVRFVARRQRKGREGWGDEGGGERASGRGIHTPGCTWRRRCARPR